MEACLTDWQNNQFSTDIYVLRHNQTPLDKIPLFVESNVFTF